MIVQPGPSNQQDTSLDQIYYIPKDKIESLKCLGYGNFGSVEKVSWDKKGVLKICACKTLHDIRKADELMKEILNMINLKDDNIVE
uniref:Protein kinase domain-containing protein n=1 Tax=Acrobeloides nanus TaxID=290746 RepID=A0A914D9A6_9BILA